MKIVKLLFQYYDIYFFKSSGWSYMTGGGCELMMFDLKRCEMFMKQQF